MWDPVQWDQGPCKTQGKSHLWWNKDQGEATTSWRPPTIARKPQWPGRGKGGRPTGPAWSPFLTRNVSHYILLQGPQSVGLFYGSFKKRRHQPASQQMRFLLFPAYLCWVSSQGEGTLTDPWTHELSWSSEVTRLLCVLTRLSRCWEVTGSAIQPLKMTDHICLPRTSLLLAWINPSGNRNV